MQSRLVFLTLILLFSISTLPMVHCISKPEEIFYAKVLFLSKSGMATAKYIRILNNRAHFSIKNTMYQTVKVILDPRIGLRVKKVIFNGKTIPYNTTFVTIGLYEVTISLKEIGYGDYEILFENYPRLSLAYILFVPDNYIKIEESRSIVAENQDKWYLYAVFVYILTTLNSENPELVTDVPHSLLSEKIVEYETPLGLSKGKELVYYVQSGNFTIKGNIISLAYKPIYVYKEFPKMSNDTIRFVNLESLQNMNGTYYLSIYIPEYFQLKNVIGLQNTTLPYNLSHSGQLVYKILDKKNIILKYKLKKIRLYFKCKTACPSSLKVMLKTKGEAREYIITDSILAIAPSLDFPLTITIYYGEVRVKDFNIFSLYDGMTLEIPLSPTTIYVVDDEGKPLESGMLIIYSLSTAEVTEYYIKHGKVDIGFLPGGSYVARVIVDSVEVGRELFNPIETNEVEVLCRVADLKIYVKDLDMQPIKNVTVSLKNAREYIQTTDEKGLVMFSQVPLAGYKIKILYKGRQIYDEIFDFSVEKEARIIVEARTLTIKLLNSWGNPIPNVEITLRSQSNEWEEIAITNENGKAVFHLIPLGDYIIEYRLGKNYMYEKKIQLSKEQSNLITIRNDVIFMIFDYAINDVLLILTIFLFFALIIFIKVFRKSGEIEISR